MGKPTMILINSFIKRNFSRFPFPSHNVSVPRLSPAEVDRVLREAEHTQEFNVSGPVKSFDTNQLRSNDPNEDMRAEAISLNNRGMYFGVFDGHAGAACAQVLAKRLFSYIEASLLPKEIINSLIEKQNLRLLDTFNDHSDFVSELKEKYNKSFLKHLRTLSKMPNMNAKEALEYGFLTLDEHISNEGLHDDGEADRKGMTVCMSGAVTCVAYISAADLYLAGVGDCQAVLGTLSDSKKWTAKKLNLEHNSDNPSEVKRITGEHPLSERSTVISNERLLGQLAPLRAFGDVRYKWSREKLLRVAVPLFGDSAIAPNYFTPPYLTARPDIMHHRLTPKDKFLVIGSDGVWELLSPLQVIRMVGEHMRGKAALSPLRINHNMKLKDIHAILMARREGLNDAPIDRNVSTHLIRHALGGTDTGLEHSRISQILSLPQDSVRLFRDDITITVIYFDSEFISHCPMSLFILLIFGFSVVSCKIVCSKHSCSAECVEVPNESACVSLGKEYRTNGSACGCCPVCPDYIPLFGVCGLKYSKIFIRHGYRRPMRKCRPGTVCIRNRCRPLPS